MRCVSHVLRIRGPREILRKRSSRFAQCAAPAAVCCTHSNLSSTTNTQVVRASALMFHKTWSPKPLRKFAECSEIALEAPSGTSKVERCAPCTRHCRVVTCANATQEVLDEHTDYGYDAAKLLESWQTPRNVHQTRIHFLKKGMRVCAANFVWGCYFTLDTCNSGATQGGHERADA